MTTAYEINEVWTKVADAGCYVTVAKTSDPAGIKVPENNTGLFPYIFAASSATQPASDTFDYQEFTDEFSYYGETGLWLRTQLGTQVVKVTLGKLGGVNGGNVTIDPVNGSEDKYLNEKGEFTEVSTAKGIWQPTVTGTYTANGNYNYITMDGINLGVELDLEIGDVVKLKTKTNKIVSGTSGIKWSGVCEHEGRRFYCADGDGIYLENLDGTLKKLSAPNARYTGIVSAIYDHVFSSRCLVLCVYGGNLKRFDYDEITEEITAVALTGTNPNRNYTGITEALDFATCVANGDIYSHALSGTTLDEVSGFDGTVKNWGGIYSGNNSFFALDKDVGDIFFWNGSSFQPKGLSSYNLRKMITYDSRCFVYSADGQCYELDVVEGYLTKLPFIPSSDYSDFSGIAFNDGARFIRGDSLGLALSDELTDIEKLHTVEFIGDGETTIGSQLLEVNSIIVNYEHCATRGNGSLKLVTVEDIVGVTIERFKKWHEAPLGLGQAWVSLSYQALDVSRFNSTNRMMNIAAGSTARDAKVTIWVDGVKVNETSDTFNALIARASGSALIPIGADYRIVWYGYNNNETIFNFWSELR